MKKLAGHVPFRCIGHLASYSRLCLAKLRISLSEKETVLVSSKERVEMEIAVNENTEHSFDHGQDNMVPEAGNHGGSEPKDEFNVEEIRSVLEVIASTGKFWCFSDWMFVRLEFLDLSLGEHPRTMDICNPVAEKVEKRTIDEECVLGKEWRKEENIIWLNEL
ncbi:hypothetical protein JRO89_XS04G0254600 [Xanthoceras sorbifolium]|uniref:Uncharacterized protein n=1 Tax=Xanthoceras sorbifolium TaxID=99658 RepID=A0ABQ8I7D2_9ROSI|nr:hypothetical protein JRO89_XS04G0254600 [Xanthoceras sorbifolium]